jgi:hypothetical protein
VAKAPAVIEPNDTKATTTLTANFIFDSKKKSEPGPRTPE